MARTQARIHTTIWSDPEFIELPSGVQRVFVLAFSQANINTCGVVPYQPKRWAKLAPDTTPTSIRRAVAMLEDRSKVVVDEATEELWVRSFVKRDGILSSPNMTVAMSREFPSVLSPAIRAALLDRLGEGFLDGLDQKVREGLYQPFVEAFGERFKQRFGEPLVQPFGEPPLAGAHAAARAEPPPPSLPPPPPGGRTVPKSGGAHRSDDLEVAGDGAPAEEIASLGDRVTAVVEHLAAQDLERTLAKQEIGNRPGWLREATKRRRTTHEAEARTLLAEGRTVAQVVVALGGDDPDDPDGSAKAEARAEATRQRAAKSAEDQREAEAAAQEADALIAELDDEERGTLRAKAEAAVPVVGGRRAELLVMSAMRRLVREGAS